MDQRLMLLLRVRPARLRARRAAGAEASALLRDLDVEAAPGGPLAEQPGIVWVTVPADRVSAAVPRLGRLGYTSAVDLLVPESEAYRFRGMGTAHALRWRRRSFRMIRLYEEDPIRLRERAPDRREFVLETGDGRMRTIRGYRGGEHPLTHRALPVPDARLLVNLVWPGTPGVLLDPFAGAGGVVIEALASRWRVVSVDRDPAVRHGLTHLGAGHVVGDACRLPLADRSVDAIATEPPYDSRVGPLVVAALIEMHRVLRPGGRIAMLCARWQAPDLAVAGSGLGLVAELDAAIDRKGTGVTAMAWRR